MPSAHSLKQAVPPNGSEAQAGAGEQFASRNFQAKIHRTTFAEPNEQRSDNDWSFPEQSMIFGVWLARTIPRAVTNEAGERGIVIRISFAIGSFVIRHLSFPRTPIDPFLWLAYNPPPQIGRGRSADRCVYRRRTWRQGCEAMTGSNRLPSKLLWVAIGTAAVMLGAAIIFQAWRAQPGTAAEDAGARAGSKNNTSSGKVPLNPPGASASKAQSDQVNESGARISRLGKSANISMKAVEDECVRRLGKEVLDNMINRAMIQLACQERNIVVTEADVNREITRIASEFKIPIEQYLQMLQAERGINPDQYRRDVIWPMLALRKLAGDEVKVSSAEIKKSFDREYGPRVKVRMILCDNLRRAQVAWQKAKEDPENFEKYVQEFSIDQASKSLDGTIPPIPRHSGSPNIEGAAFKLKLGEISAIVQLDDAAQRYVILKCEGFTEPVVRKLDAEVQAELEDQIKRQKVQEQVASVFEALKKETRVDNYYTGESTGGLKPSNVSRTDGAKPTGAKPIGTRPATKTVPANDETGSIRQTGAKGTTSKTVKPAVASSDDDDLPPPRTAPRQPTTSTK